MRFLDGDDDTVSNLQSKTYIYSLALLKPRLRCLGSIFQISFISSGVATSSVGEYTTVYNPDSKYKALSLADRVAVACFCPRFGVYRQHGVQIHREFTKLVCDKAWMELATVRSITT
jgi:hypothetical protein